MSNFKKRGFLHSFAIGFGYSPDMFGRCPTVVLPRRMPLSDNSAVASDWKAVGKDMRDAIAQFEAEAASELTAASEQKAFAYSGV